MRDFLIRCSSLGALMTEPVRPEPQFITPEIAEIMKAKSRSDAQKAALAAAKERSLSEGGKTAVRKLVREEIYGVEIRVDSKEMEKGRRLEGDAIELVNRVRGLSLTKNTERRHDQHITGECDLFDVSTAEGRDTKVPWSIASMPIAFEDCQDNDYWWQMQGYMRLWNACRWHVDWVLLSTPPDLIRYEPIELHSVDHIDEALRITTWSIDRDVEAQRLIPIKVQRARQYGLEVLAAFERLHPIDGPVLA